jgi:primosomal replication protein N
VDNKDPHIRSQNSAHRRGLVLGLTMAEIMVLILFTLLLALAAAIAAKNRTINDQQHRIALLKPIQEQLRELFQANPGGVTVKDVIARLERQQKENDVLRQQVERLKPYEASGKALEDIIREIKRGGDRDVTPEQVVEKLREVTQLSKDNDTLRGQVAQLSSQIKAAGRGNEFPSCWVTPDGKVESIFELLVTGNGIVVKDHYLANRVADKADLPLSGVRYDTELSRAEFLGETRSLYQWSVDHGCRFYVIRFTSVANAPVDLLNAMDAYFYPDSKLKYRPGGL